MDELSKKLSTNPLPSCISLNDENGKYIPIHIVEDMLDEVFGWSNWNYQIKSYSRNFDKLDVVVTLSVVIDGVCTVSRDGSATHTIKPVNKNSDGTDINDMDLPIAASFALANAAKKFGRYFGRHLNKDAASVNTTVIKAKKDVNNTKKDDVMSELNKLIKKRKTKIDETPDKTTEAAF
jgi:hypothetical protein